MATHSSILAWRIPWTGEPHDYSPSGRRVGHALVTEEGDFFFKSLLNLLQYRFSFMIWLFGHKAYGILVPQPGMEPALPDGKAKSQQWMAREVPGKCDHPNFFFSTSHGL